jgi:hypothetical protein
MPYHSRHYDDDDDLEEESDDDDEDDDNDDDNDDEDEDEDEESDNEDEEDRGSNSRKRCYKHQKSCNERKFYKRSEQHANVRGMGGGSAYSSNHVRSVSSPSAGVYVLRNQQTNTHYVGKSGNVTNRIGQHQRESNGEVLIRENTVTSGSVDDLESWERNEVLTRMYLDGMDSVRGWRYTRRGPLTMEERTSAKKDIIEKFDLCRRCGRNSHFADKCFARSPSFWCQDIPM